MVVGCNHTTVSIDVLERVAIGPEALPKALADLIRREHLSEVAVLSTCNRTEIYAVCTRFHPAVEDVYAFFSDVQGVDVAAYGEGFYTYYDDAALTHLFSVAAGMDSLVVGEGEILGQTRRAWSAAIDEGTAGAGLARAFRHAIETGKRARTDTAIAQYAVSVSAAAVALAEDVLGTLDDRRVLVLGAGEIGAGIVHALRAAGATDITIANRTPEHATALADAVDGQVIGLGAIGQALRDADLLLASTGATTALLDRSDFVAVLAERPERPLLIVDVAIPRDVDPSVAELPGVTLLDMDALHRVVDSWRDQRSAALDEVRSIVRAAVERHRADHSGRAVAPVIAALRDRSSSIAAAELNRFAPRLAGLTPEQRSAVEAIVEATTNKLLHDPMVRLKGAAGTTRGEVLADALTDLFALDDQPQEASDTE